MYFGSETKLQQGLDGDKYHSFHVILDNDRQLRNTNYIYHKKNVS